MSEIGDIVTVRATFSGPLALAFENYILDTHDIDTSRDAVAKELVLTQLREEGYL